MLAFNISFVSRWFYQRLKQIQSISVLIKKKLHTANVPHNNIWRYLCIVYCFIAMDKLEIRHTHSVYILPLHLLPYTHGKIDHYINVIVFAPYVLYKSFWGLFFYRNCKLIYSLKDNKLCFVLPFTTIYQSLAF